MALDPTKPFVLNVVGADIPVRPTRSKKTDNVYWAVLTPKADGSRVDTGFGVGVAAKAPTLPDRVTLVGQDGKKTVLPLTAAPATYVDRDSKQVKARKNPAVRVQQQVVLSGDTKQVKVSISDTGDGKWNLKVTISGVSGGGTARTFDAADL